MILKGLKPRAVTNRQRGSVYCHERLSIGSVRGAKTGDAIDLGIHEHSLEMRMYVRKFTISFKQDAIQGKKFSSVDRERDRRGKC